MKRHIVVLDVAAAGPSPHRGRIVMLADNGVRGDSRVQKVARSAADAGWEVILLGRSPVSQAQSWRLGEAQVRLLPMPDPLARRRHEFRRAWLRWPLAYPPNGIAAHRAQWVKAWRADLRVRAARLTLVERADQRRRPWARRWLRVQELAAKGLGKWVSFRYWQLTRARTGRKLRSPWDRAYTLIWQALLGDRAWRRLEPGLWDYELAYGPVVDSLAPDLIHAHDFRMVGVGARAKIRAAAKGRQVRLVWDAHEYLPGLQPWQDHARWLPAHCAHEREYVPYADAAVTVSDTLAELLQERHRLPQRPVVVLNTPDVAPGPGAPASPTPAGANGARPAVPDVRSRCDLGPEVPLLVYSGAAAHRRGLDTIVDALPDLPAAHAALVVNKPQSPYLRQLRARAASLGVADRVHVLPYVEPDDVVGYLATADIGVIPIHHWPNHEIALITKFFEYAHARLPIVVSDVRTMADTVRRTGQGEVFTAGDTADFVRAARAVLADPRRYRSVYETTGILGGWTWQAQAAVLDGLYSRLLAPGDRVESTHRPAVPAAAP